MDRYETTVSADTDSTATLGVPTEGCGSERLYQPALTLLMGTSRSDSERLHCHHLLRPSDADILIVDFTRFPDERLTEVYRCGDPIGDLRILSCVAGRRGFTKDQSVNTDQARHVIETIPMPDDLLKIGIRIIEIFDEWRSNPREIAVCINSLTSLLHYVDNGEAFRFLNVLKGHVYEVGAQVHLHVERGAHDPFTLNQFHPLFEAIVDTATLDSGEPLLP